MSAGVFNGMRSRSRMTATPATRAPAAERDADYVGALACDDRPRDADERDTLVLLVSLRHVGPGPVPDPPR
jgi:hypothetical protein